MKYTCVVLIMICYLKRNVVSQQDFRKDVIFMLDGTLEMKGYFKAALKSIETVINSCNDGPEALRVGLVVFGDNSKIIFNLNDHTNIPDLIKAIEMTSFPSAVVRNISAGLQVARDGFSIENGGRENLPDIIVLMTGGISDTEYNLTMPEIEHTREAGISVVSVGVDVKTKHEETMIATLASYPNHTVMAVSMDNLGTDMAIILFGSKSAHIVISVGVIIAVVVLVVIAVAVIVGVVVLRRHSKYKLSNEIVKLLKEPNNDKGLLSKEGLLFVSSKLGTEWECLATYLGLEKHEIDQITEVRLGPRDTRVVVLKMWKRNRTDKVSCDKNQELLKALYDIDRADIIRDLKKKYQIDFIEDSV